MKRSTTRWTTAVAAAALLALPVGSQAQTATTQPQTTTTTTRAAQAAATPEYHLRKAEAAVNDIEMASVSGSARTRIAELKQHLDKLQRAAAGNDSASATGEAARSDAATASARGNLSWQTEAAAVDRIITELLGTAAPPSGEPGATGTSGTPAASLDANTRSKLAEVRTHMTAFVAAKSAVPASAANVSSAAGGATGTSEPPASSASSTAQTPTSSASTTQPQASQPQASTTQPPAQAPAAATDAAQPAVDQEAAKRHLTAARNSLSQLTQLPAAAQLTGDARTQVSQLITNFNELITTDTEWRASYAKVEANLIALLGSQTTDESSAASAASGTAGAVGTAGATATGLDPQIRAKLVEFRNHLSAFEKVVGGQPEPAQTPAGTTTPGAQAPTGASAAAGTVSHDEALRHIAAIEAILNGQPAAAGTSGTATAGTTGTAAAAGVTLSAAQIDQLRNHLNELRRLINEK